MALSLVSRRLPLHHVLPLYGHVRLFTPSPQHVALQDHLLKLIEREINPHCEGWERSRMFPAREVFKVLGDAGYLGISLPVEYGGLGLDISYEAVAAETAAHIASGGVGMGIGIQCNIGTQSLARHGSAELKERYLRPAIAGEAVVCLGVSEVGGGSDVAAIRTTARKEGEEYVVNGGKMWITNGVQADWMCMLANTSEGHPHRNKSLLVVPMDSPGVTRRLIDKMGMHASDTGDITLEEVRVPADHLIGEQGKGFTYQMQSFQTERILIAAGTIAAMDQCIAATIEYTSQRMVFGKPVLDNQYIHYQLAEFQTELECVRALYYKCIDDYIAGQDITPLATMLKLKSARLVRQVTDGCLQFWGGMGYTEEAKVSRLFRDMRLMSIGGGTDEVMLSILCKYMGIAPDMNM